jgi:hypothetical protein
VKESTLTRAQVKRLLDEAASCRSMRWPEPANSPDKPNYSEALAEEIRTQSNLDE